MDRRLRRLLVVVALALLAVSALGCNEELCMGPRNMRCEGDVLVRCPGGWGNIDFTVERDDCRKVGERCIQYVLNGFREPWCVAPAGTCDANTHAARCVAEEGRGDSEWGKQLECIRGELFVSGPECRLEATE